MYSFVFPLPINHKMRLPVDDLSIHLDKSSYLSILSIGLDSADIKNSMAKFENIYHLRGSANDGN